jgi:hypothetical protein
MKNSSKRNQKLCLDCQQRRARFRFRGVVKWDHDHTLCMSCFRAQSNRLRVLLREASL